MKWKAENLQLVGRGGLPSRGEKTTTCNVMQWYPKINKVNQRKHTLRCGRCINIIANARQRAFGWRPNGEWGTSSPLEVLNRLKRLRSPLPTTANRRAANAPTLAPRGRLQRPMGIDSCLAFTGFQTPSGFGWTRLWSWSPAMSSKCKLSVIMFVLGFQGEQKDFITPTQLSVTM